ncbi:MULTISPECIES: YtxH domain-containing protein [unclassified Streptomyces]|uniref:YtxH domain-containing protein n=1 Tax=unclassified Streptomyces TaxID=2593676 RepID=UPI001FAD3409|nr:YtxH domain-containing protein [Streptomyces sp. PBSH9]
MSDFESLSRPDSGTTTTAAQTARDKASEGADLVTDKAGDVAGTAKEQTADVAGEATARAQDLVSELRSQLEEQARSQTQRLAGNVRRLADDLHDMSRHSDSDSSAASAVRQIADRGHQAASRLEDRGPGGLLSDLQDFARRRPGAFLAGAALAGFATARLAKGAKSGDGGEGPASTREDSKVRNAPRIGTGREASRAPGADPRPAPPSPSPTPSYGGDPARGPAPVSDPYPDPQQR